MCSRLDGGSSFINRRIFKIILRYVLPRQLVQTHVTMGMGRSLVEIAIQRGNTVFTNSVDIDSHVSENFIIMRFRFQVSTMTQYRDKILYIPFY